MGSLRDLTLKIGANVDPLKAGLADAKGQLGGFQNSIKSLGPAIAGAFSVGAVMAFGKAAFAASEEQERANRRMMNAVGGNISQYEELTAQAEQLRSSTGIDDAAIMQIQMLGRSADLTTQQIKDITAASIELASKTDGDLQSAYMALVKTYTGVLGKSLKGMGQDFNNLSEEQLKSGDAIKLVLKKFSGGAADTASAVDILKSNWGEFMESVGNSISKVLNPALEKTNDVIKKLKQLKNGEYNPASFSGNNPYFGPKTFTTYKIDVYEPGSASMEQARKAAEEVQRNYDNWQQNYDAAVKKRKEAEKERLDLIKKQNEALEEQMRKIHDLDKIAKDNVKYTDITFKEMGWATNDVQLLQPKGLSFSNSLASRTKTATGSAAEGAALTEDNIAAVEALNEKLKEQQAMAGLATDAIVGLGDAFGSLAATGELSMKELVLTTIGGIKQIINAKLAEAIAGQIANGSSKGLPGLLLAGIGISAVYAMFSQLPAFAHGGIVGGNTYAGDSKMARVNSGEMILNGTQQAALFAIANGGGVGGRELYATIKSGDIYLSNKRGSYLSQRRG